MITKNSTYLRLPAAAFMRYLALSMHVPEGYSSYLVCRSVNLSTPDLSDRLVLNLE